MSKQDKQWLQIFVMYISNKKFESTICKDIPHVNNQKQTTQWETGKSFAHILHKGTMWLSNRKMKFFSTLLIGSEI